MTFPAGHYQPQSEKALTVAFVAITSVLRSGFDPDCKGDLATDGAELFQRDP